MRPKKSYGQHFLTAPSYARRIAEAIPAGPDEKVVEIGPGTGALTIHLVRRFPALHCVEADRDVVPRLEQKLGGGEYTIHVHDALKFDFGKVGFPLHVVGNLPYSAGALIIKKVLLLGNRVSSCTFMVQREVSERICAGPHSRKNGFLSVFCQFFGEPRILFHVPPGAFFPRPKVDSSVFQMSIRESAGAVLDESRWPAFFAFVDKGFSQRRKQLAGLLGKAYRGVDVGDLLESIGVERTSRAEDLGVEEWVRLFGQVEA